MFKLTCRNPNKTVFVAVIWTTDETWFYFRLP